MAKNHQEHTWIPRQVWSKSECSSELWDVSKGRTRERVIEELGV